MPVKISAKRVRWDITNKCNLACLHCYTSDIAVPDLPLSDVIKILEILLTNGLRELNLSGREPTMRDDLPQIITWCRESDVAVNMTTNGTRLDNIELQRILHGLGMIVFSLDGPSAACHDKIRGQGNFLKTISSIKQCRNHREYQDADLQIGISCTLQKYNCREIHLMISLCTSLGIDFLSINPISFCGSALQRIGILQLTNNEIMTAWEEVCAHYSRSQPSFDLYLGTYPMETRLLNLKYGLNLPVIQDGCSAGKTLYIDARGEAYPCYMIPPMAAAKPEFKKYLHSWKVLTDPISHAEVDFQSFITFANMHSQHNNASCRHCPDIEICRRCPLVSLFDSETLKRCELARNQLKSMRIDLKPWAIPKVKESIRWRMKRNSIHIYTIKGNYNSNKEFILNPMAQEIWFEINRGSNMWQIERMLAQKFGHVSQEMRITCLRVCIDCLWKEGIIEWEYHDK